jgi:hypothetical protein
LFNCHAGPVAEQVLLLENIATSIKTGPDQLPTVHNLLLEAVSAVSAGLSGRLCSCLEWQLAATAAAATYAVQAEHCAPWLTAVTVHIRGRGSSRQQQQQQQTRSMQLHGCERNS